jgi:hypothetical protein
MTTVTTIIELTAGEVRLLLNALETYASDFGHDEADLIRAVEALSARLRALHSEPAR